jgi:hypothetical protein
VRRHFVRLILKGFRNPSARSNCPGRVCFLDVGKAHHAILHHTPEDLSRRRHHYHRCEDHKSHILFCSFRICITELKKLHCVFSKVNADRTVWKSYSTEHPTVHGCYAHTRTSEIKKLRGRHFLNLRGFFEEVSGNFLRNIDTFVISALKCPGSYRHSLCAE